MSGRGGRGGRGGRWGGRITATKELIRDNLEDLGIDQYQTQFDERQPPPLQPSIELPVSVPLTEDETIVIGLHNKLIER